MTCAAPPVVDSLTATTTIAPPVVVDTLESVGNNYKDTLIKLAKRTIKYTVKYEVGIDTEKLVDLLENADVIEGMDLVMLGYKGYGKVAKALANAGHSGGAAPYLNALLSRNLEYFIENAETLKMASGAKEDGKADIDCVVALLRSGRLTAKEMDYIWKALYYLVEGAFKFLSLEGAPHPSRWGIDPAHLAMVVFPPLEA